MNTSKVIDGVTYAFGPDGVCTTGVQVANYYDADAVAEQMNNANNTDNTTKTETDEYGKNNVIVAGDRR